MPSQTKRRHASPESQAHANGSRAMAKGEPIVHPRQALAELVGTFLLTLVAAGAEVIAAISGGQVSPAARALAPGLLVMALIYALGDVSGAHFNPGVTWAFALRRVFPWSRVPIYWATQFAGACLAALLLWALFGDVNDLGANQPHHGVAQSLVMEVLLTFLLLLVILGTATRHQLIGPDAAIAVGATIALCGLFAGPVSGASMNTARSLGPALLSGAYGHAWIYVVGPLMGATAAVGLVTLCHAHRHPGEDEAARGKDG